MKYKIFINHTQKESDLAKDLARRLEEAGVNVFPVEKSGVNGEGVITSVNPGLRDADEVIVIVTDSSVNSPGLNSQTGAALGLLQRVTRIVVGIDEDDLPPFIGKTVRYADLHEYIPTIARRRPRTTKQRLIQAMQLVFDRNANSNWNYDMEDSLWDLTQRLPDKETVKRVIDQAWYNLTLEDVEELRELSDKAGGWVHAREGKPVFVDRKTWKEIHHSANRLAHYSLPLNAKSSAIKA
ncbi:MAG TPA: toll/interleukin-1 receptor domain-containing protein [Blastocatellia bacterium]|nr:toll/interleukin-1 receptor domain-containing protein [Blastocatellia bacterium]